MDKLLIETQVGNCTYLGTGDNLYLALKKYTQPENINEQLTLNPNTEIILENAFDGGNLNELVIGQKVKKIKKDAFKTCSISSVIYRGFVNDWASIEFENYYANPCCCATIPFQAIDINVPVVKAFAFINCQLATVRFGDQVRVVENSAFLNSTIQTTTVSDIDTWCNIKFESQFSNPIYYSKNLLINGSVATSLSINSDISDYAFINLESLTDVTIGANVAHVGCSAFQGCTNLNISTDGMGKYLGTTNRILIGIDEAIDTLMTGSYQAVATDTQTKHRGYLDTGKTILGRYDGEFVNTTKFILDKAFYDCNLTQITIPNSVTYIGSEAFMHSGELGNIAIPDSVTYIGVRCFEDCRSLKTVIFGNGITEIPINTCASCDALESITVPNTIKKIKAGAFSDCIKLRRIVIDPVNSQLEYIGDKAFLQCRSLGIVEDIENDDFNYNKLIIPATVKYIGKQAFYDCYSLRKVDIYCNKDVIINKDSFACCFGMVEVYAPNLGVQIGEDKATLLLGSPSWGYLGYYAAEVVYDINDCGVLELTEDNLIIYGIPTNEGKVDFSTASIVEYIGEATALTLPEVKRIKPYAFYNQQDLMKIIIPNTTNRLQSIGVSAFEKCAKLAFKEDGNGLYYLSSNGNPYFALVGVRSVENLPTTIEINPNTKFICQGALNGLNTVETIITPCCGDRILPNTFSATEYYMPFGNLFGKDSFSENNLVSALSFYSGSHNGQVGEIYTSSYYIPSSLTEVVVRNNNGTIPDGCFFNYTNLSTLTLPNNLTSIGEGAFYGCDNVQMITIPSTVTSVKDCAFYNLENVEILVDDNCQTSVGKYAFYNCEGLYEEIKLQDYVGDYAFYGCDNLTDITITNTVQYIGDYAFKDLSSDITISNCTTSVGDYAFYECDNLSGSISITNFVGNYAFTGSDGLTSVSILNTVENVGSHAFYNLTSLPISVANNCITAIQDYGFYNCAGLSEKISIKDILGEHALDNCSSLEEIVVLNSILSINASAFTGCSVLESITLPFIGNNASASSASASTLFGYIFGSTSYTGGTAVTQYYSDNDSVTYYIPSTLRSVTITGGNVYYGAFYGLLMLTSLTIPANLLSIEDCTFYGCSGLTNITIPNSATSIGNEAFNGCSSITAVTIPNNVTLIGASAFSGCSGIETLSIGNSVTLIGEYAFYNCSSVESIVIPNSVTTIGQYAFQNCSSATTLSIGNGVTTIPQGMFAGCYAFETIVIGTGVTSLAGAIFAGCSALTTITLPFVGGSANASTASASTLFGYIFGSSAYTGSTAVTQYYAPGYSATYYIPSTLRSVTITGGNILSGAFYRLSMLTNITIPTNLLSIEDYAFYDCEGLTNITIPDNVSSIGDYALSRCNSLTTVTFNSNLHTVGNYLFSQCTGLTSVSFPASITSMGERIFDKCPSLINITIPFIGDVAGKTSSSSDQYPLGYIFGRTSYDGAQPVVQNYYASSSKTSMLSYIPTSLRSVTVLGSNVLEGAFERCSMLTEVIINNNNNTTIAAESFSGCGNLTTLSLPFITNTLGYIFGNTSYTGGVQIYQHTSSGSSTMMYYVPSGLHNVTISSGSIPYGAFDAFNMIQSITIGSGVNSINTASTYTFNCASLATLVVDINNSRYDSRNNCNAIIDTSLNKLIVATNGTTIIPTGVIELGYGAFTNCSALTSITIPVTVTQIGNSCFAGCTALTSVNYLGDLEAWLNIDFDMGAHTGNPCYYAHNVTFSDGTDLTGIVTIPNNITAIKNCVFIGCSYMTQIIIPSGVSQIGVRAFSYCSGLTDINIPSTVRTIQGGAFEHCTSLTSITIPNTVTNIGNAGRASNWGILAGCTSLTSITIPFIGDSLKTRSDSNRYPFGYLFGTQNIPDTTAVSQFYYETPSSSSQTITYYIPTSLTNVTVTNGEILYNVFMNCSMIENLSLINGVSKIESQGCARCANLLELTIGENILEIGSNAFDSSTLLATINYQGTIAEWGDINLSSYWNFNIAATVVHCTDGDVNI